MHHEDRDSHRAMTSPGCTGECEWGEPCNCSHAKAWRAPRQPRRPEPRTPHLPLWTRFTLWAQSRMAFVGDFGDLVAVALILLGMGLAMGAAGAMVLLS